jgi:Tfp pilus assembly protein PilZ
MNISFKGKKESHVFKERRSSERIQTNMYARFFFGNMFYSGTVLNVSDSGMFISTKRFLPADAIFVVIIRLENELLKVIANVNRIALTSGNTAGIGVTLLSPSRSYLDLVGKIKTV